jgi:hypothetical protein
VPNPHGKEVIRMSLETVQRVIFLAVTNAEFRNALKANPDEFLAQRELSPEEIVSLKATDWDSVSTVGHDLEERVSRFGFAVAECK